jgi:hypothetical protein
VAEKIDDVGLLSFPFFSSSFSHRVQKKIERRGEGKVYENFKTCFKQFIN